ncbi:MAG TPA: phospholipase D-like domain-containing protein [Candidatus Saccharimonadales bacterium]|nr:phospholipase D-like domain-containing protein [Candidatus Saccharimonadales bacterium]
MRTTKASAIQTSALHLLDADDYHTALLKAIKSAKHRVVVAAMILVWGERTAPIFEALQGAVKRGVAVTILLDNYTRLSAAYHLRPRTTRSERVRRTFETIEQLSSLGATVYCYGKIGLLPHKGRCHVKISIVDDTYYSFGGINIVDQSFSAHDFMFRGENPKIANTLEAIVTDIGTKSPPLPDNEIQLTDQHALLFDGGRPGHSLIYERACELAAQATRLYCVTQFTPSGPLAKLMHETEAVSYFNRPEQLVAPDAWGQAFDQQRYRLPNAYTGTTYIHAKFIIAKLRSGQYASLTGSHNFSYRGVAFGTQEIALYSTDKAVWERLHSYMQALIQP